jgi:hypothetical protein
MKDRKLLAPMISFRVRSHGLDRHADVGRTAVVAQLVSDRSLDIENLERVECQTAVVTVRISETRDRIEDCLIDVRPGADCRDDVLMLMVFRHEFLLELSGARRRATAGINFLT